MRWFGISRKEPGWMVVVQGEDATSFVHARHLNGEGAELLGWSIEPGRRRADLPKLAREHSLARYECMTLLEPREYQLLVVEAPNVPASEAKSAIRWRVKDLLDYPVDDATIDVLDIPPDPAGVSGSHQMYAVAARNDLIRARMKEFEDARIPLRVIDIAETAQRNVACLYEEPERGVALLYLGEDFGLVTVNFRGELYHARRLEIGHAQLASAQAGAREEVFGRLLLELQRTLDHCDRQFRFVSVSRLLLAPEPQDTGLREFLAQNLGLPVQAIDLADRISVAAPSPPDARTQWRLFHPLGAALRHEAGTH
jgi:MSHA biogenesis protein MshI